MPGPPPSFVNMAIVFRMFLLFSSDLFTHPQPLGLLATYSMSAILWWGVILPHLVPKLPRNGDHHLTLKIPKKILMVPLKGEIYGIWIISH